jgi:pyruvate dehydrogenase E2 component (dihydrolipoyllysine-residue acetyltransferase)
MATKVHMEALSPTMEEGQLVRWLKHEGDEIGEGDILAEIETDKATMELVARGSGVLRKVGLPEGATAKVGEVIAVIAASDEDIAGLISEMAGAGAGNGKPASAAPSAAAPSAPPAEQATAARSVPAAAVASAEPAAQAAPTATTDAGDGRLKASPLARRLAAEAGVTLAAVAGSGPGGRIIKRDVEAAAKAPARPVAVAGAAAPVRASVGPDTEDVAVSQMRKTIAKRLVSSIGPIPTFYLTVDLDMTRLLAARQEVNRRLESRGVKTSINDYVVKALALALSVHPEVNASWGETVITRHHRVHIGVAVAVEDGLITPVIRDAHLKGVAEISAEVRELAGRAREKRLKPDEYTGSTFSISNLGMFGIEEFTAIINPPEAGILAVGQVEEKVIAENGAVVIRPRMRVTMSCDHRVVDGATGARFLQTFRGFIEEPVMMLV